MIGHASRGDHYPAMYGETVRVYRNLHADRWSVQARRAGRWVVVAHVGALSLSDCHAVVSEAGRQRVIERRRKGVHAFIVGTLRSDYTRPGEHAERITYNPFRSGAFECAGQPLTAAFAASFDLIGRAWIPAVPLI